MKLTIFYITLFLFSSISYCQENCNNGIDDDGDGKIDLNDLDCICNQTAVRSIIPNHSFEEYSFCKEAKIWVPANNSRTEYINCGLDLDGQEILKNGLSNYPDGFGIYGAMYTGNKKGYIGTCLISPMLAGEEYQLTLDIATLIVGGDAALGTSNKVSKENFKQLRVSELEPINITLYGTSNCENLPLTSDVYVNIYQSPPTYGPKWIEIGSVTYTPVSKWEKITITFTPTVDIEAIILGSPQKLPESYPYAPFRGPYEAPFFLYDDLILNKSSLFGVNILRNGAFCENNLVLTANPTILITPSIKYQWYKEGIAIVGATNKDFSIPYETKNYGNYIVKITDNTGCILSSPYNLNNTIPEPTVLITQPTCSVNTGTITITSPAKEYSFDRGKTWTTNNVATNLVSKTYFIKTRNVLNCEASKIVVINNLLNFPEIYATTPISYVQFAVAKELTAGGTNHLWYTTETGGTGSTETPIPQTSILGSTDYYVSQTINGCEDNQRKKITVTIYPVPYAFEYPHFFTPNGDGENDFWNIPEFVKENEALIYIYDRYGKSLAIIKPNDIGWDGNYQGVPLPSNDYWFKAIYKENGELTEFKSHFTLKR
jgi:large repetitive protein